MRCGLCGATEFQYRSRTGELGGLLTILDSGYLSLHKRQAHPEEMDAARQKARDKRAQTKTDAKDLAQRRLQAAQDAQHGVVLRQYNPDSTTVVGRLPIFSLFSEHGYYRYADPFHWGRVDKLDSEISMLQRLRDEAMVIAFEQGEPITVEENQRIQDIVDQVT